MACHARDWTEFLIVLPKTVPRLHSSVTHFLSLSTLQKGAPRARKSVSTTTVSSDSSSEKSGSEAGKKRESARLKLKQMKEAAMRAKNNRGENGGMDDVMVMFPGMKVADSREGSVFKAPPSVVLSTNEGTAGAVQARTPVTVGQQGVRTRGSSLRRSTRKSKIIDPAQVGCWKEHFIVFTTQVVLYVFRFSLRRECPSQCTPESVTIGVSVSLWLPWQECMYDTLMCVCTYVYVCTYRDIP